MLHHQRGKAETAGLEMTVEPFESLSPPLSSALEGNPCLCFAVVISDQICHDGGRGRHVPANARRRDPATVAATAAACYWCTDVELCVMELWDTCTRFPVVSN